LVPALTQTSVGDCPAGASFWDLGLVGDSSSTPGAQRLNPVSSILTSTSGYPGNSNANPQVASGYCNGPRTLRLLAGITTLVPVPALDEGGNWIDVRWGPLTLTGDYHLTSGSPLNTGSAAGAPNHDFDGNGRPQGAGFDIGADEFGTGGGGGGTTLPALTVLDNFNRANSGNLGANWNSTNASIVGNLAVSIFGGNAYWAGAGNPFGNSQGAAFTFAGLLPPINNTGLVLKASGGTATNPANYVRVRYQSGGGGSVTIATVTGGTATTVATLTGFGDFANGDTLTATVDATGAVQVWRTRAGTSTLLTSSPVSTSFTGGGRTGMQLGPVSAVDNFASGTLP
jgi:hypothetical protein